MVNSCLFKSTKKLLFFLFINKPKIENHLTIPPSVFDNLCRNMIYPRHSDFFLFKLCFLNGSPVNFSVKKVFIFIIALIPAF